ncbi:MAG: DUF4403 family protein [Siphonobacter sp.]
MLRLAIWTGLIFTFLLTGCGRSNQSNPPAPKESYLYTKKQVESRKYLSTIAVPVEITLSDVENQINTNISDLIYEDLSYDDNDQDNLMVRVWKRGRIAIVPGVSTNNQSSFNLTIPLRIWIRTRYSLLGLSTEKEISFEINLKLNTQFSISPNWQAHTQTQLTGYDWVSKPVLKLGPISIPISGIVAKTLDSKKESLGKAIDDAVQKNVEIKKYVVQAWNLALQPRLISEKYRTWLKLTPVQLQMTPFRTVGKAIQATLGILTYTETVFGTKPIVSELNQIPDLKINPTVGNEFKVGLISDITHAEAQRMVKDTVVGQKFTYGSYSVTIKDIELYGDAKDLVIRATLEGSINGYVYLKGIPYYDPVHRTISLRDLQYDLDTKSFLVHSANWLLQSRLRKSLQSALTFPVGDQLEETKRHMQTLLNKNQVAKGVILNGSIQAITPDQVYLTPESIMAVVFVTGNVRLHIEGL